MTNEASTTKAGPVVILGAGINGASVARSLAVNGIPVHIVDANDFATGATSKSSRLIHGGLRYLEYGDFRLVQESLAERTRLLRLAPQYVTPLQLSIPIEGRFGGFWQSVGRFLRIGRTRLGHFLGSQAKPAVRGLYVVQLGLKFYDLLSGKSQLPRSRTHPVDELTLPHVDKARFRWICNYWDAQMLYPERYVAALLSDAQAAAAEVGVEFRLWTYHRAEIDAESVRIYGNADNNQPVSTLHPSVVVNATGAWGDLTLEQLHVRSDRLFGGTKGSHFLTRNNQLRTAIGDHGIYAEAADGRLVFVLPFGDAVLVGTTDERFRDTPDRAVASGEELSYLLEMVNSVVPQAALTHEDIGMHYSGVRPLPYAPAGKAASIPRGHWIDVNESEAIPILTLIGGKLTTSRCLGDEVADWIMNRMQWAKAADTNDRIIPGGAGYPANPKLVESRQRELAENFGQPIECVRAIWRLYGTTTEQILAEQVHSTDEVLDATDYPLFLVDWILQREWVTTLDDLVERRLMLVYHAPLTERCLSQLAWRLCDADLLSANAVDQAVRQTIDRLESFYGLSVSRQPLRDSDSTSSSS